MDTGQRTVDTYFCEERLALTYSTVQYIVKFVASFHDSDILFSTVSILSKISMVYTQQSWYSTLIDLVE
jgi:hypothetical protein